MQPYSLKIRYSLEKAIYPYSLEKAKQYSYLLEKAKHSLKKVK